MRRWQHCKLVLLYTGASNLPECGVIVTRLPSLWVKIGCKVVSDSCIPPVDSLSFEENVVEYVGNGRLLLAGSPSFAVEALIRPNPSMCINNITPRAMLCTR